MTDEKYIDISVYRHFYFSQTKYDGSDSLWRIRADSRTDGYRDLQNHINTNNLKKDGDQDIAYVGNNYLEKEMDIAEFNTEDGEFDPEVLVYRVVSLTTMVSE